MKTAELLQTQTPREIGLLNLGLSGMLTSAPLVDFVSDWMLDFLVSVEFIQTCEDVQTALILEEEYRRVVMIGAHMTGHPNFLDFANSYTEETVLHFLGIAKN
jgi:hypothetical protein